jgi:hypothetical protein
MKSRQQGVTLVGFLFIMAIAGFFAFMGMKLWPPYYHYFGVVKGMKEMSKEDLSGKTRGQIRREFMYKLSFQYADDQFGPNAIRIEQGNGATVLHVTYDKRVHFLYNIDFLLHFEKSVPLTGVSD